MKVIAVTAGKNGQRNAAYIEERPYRCAGCHHSSDLDGLSLVMRDDVAAMLCSACLLRVLGVPREAAVRLSEATKGETL